MSEQKITSQENPGAQPELDQSQVDYGIQRLQEEENFSFAVVAGVVAAALGAAVWAGVTVVTEYQIGWMAVGVGLLVAFSIRFTGKGLSAKFQVIGALLALLGCVAGNFLTLCYFIAQNEGMGVFEVLTQINPAAIPEIMISTFSGIDAIFYGIAVYEGYRFSLRQVSEDELEAVTNPGSVNRSAEQNAAHGLGVPQGQAFK